MYCNGSGREEDDTPCSNPNYAPNCSYCGGAGARTTIHEQPIRAKDL